MFVFNSMAPLPCPFPKLPELIALKMKQYSILLKPIKMITLICAIAICILSAILLGIVILIIPIKKMLIIEKWIKAFRSNIRRET